MTRLILMLCISEPTVHVDKQPPRLVAAEWRNGRQDESMSANKTRQLAGFVTQKTFILYMVYIMILCGENAFGPTHSLQYHKYVCAPQMSHYASVHLFSTLLDHPFTHLSKPRTQCILLKWLSVTIKVQSPN